MHANRPGPTRLKEQYEGQMDLLGLPIEYVGTMLLPETSEPRRVPDEVVATTAIFKAPQIVEDLPVTGSWNSANCSTNGVDTAGESTVMVFPGTLGTIWHSPANSFIAAAGVGISFRASIVTGRSQSDDDAGAPVRWMSHGLRHADYGFLPRFRDSGSMHIEVLRAGGDMIVGVKTDPSYTRVGTLRFQYNIGGTFTNLDVPIGIVAGVGSVTLTTIPPLIESFAIGLLNTEGLPQDLEFSLHDLGGWTVSQNSATMYDIKAVDQLADMPLTFQERPSAMSLLATYMGSTLANGGNIALARLPMGSSLSSAPSGDYYSYIAALPVYAGDFALKDGGYAWWCPDSEQEYFFHPYGESASDDIRARSSLVCTMRRDEPSQTVRLRVDLHVETQTRSALFTSLVSDASSSFSKALQIAKTIPAVSINDTHRGFFGKIWDGVKNWAKNPTNWLNLVKKGVTALPALL